MAIANTIVSVFSNEKRKNGEESAKKILTVASFVMSILSIIFILINLCAAEIVVKVVAQGFDEKTLGLAVSLTRITCFCILFISLSYVLNGFLQYKEKFFWTSFSGTYTSLIIIILALLGVKKIELYALAWVLGALLQFITVYYVSKKNGYKLKILFNKEDKIFIKDILYLSVPLMISYSIQQINVIVDKSIASSLFVGAVSSLNYANIIIVAITAIFITSIVTVRYSKMARIEENKDFIEFTKKTIDLMSYIMIPITFVIILFSKSIINILFVGGEFDLIALDNTYKALICYSLGLIFISYRDVLVRVCLVKDNSKIPMISNILAVILNVILNIILSKYFSHLGLALATSISLFISVVVLMTLVKRNYGNIFDRNNVNNAIKVILTSLLLSIFVILLNNYFNEIIMSSKFTNLIYCIIIASIFIILYLIIMKLLKTDCITEIKRCLKDRE